MCVCFKRGYILSSKPSGHFTTQLVQAAIELVVVVVVVVVVVGVVVILLVLILAEAAIDLNST
jgi:hypothetical protein